jgi:quercetin dioxygenase-like cupin family protein
MQSTRSPSDASRLGASNVHFTTGTRTAWHTHPQDQINGTEGAGLCCVAASIEVIAPGGGVFFEPGEDYWHGALPRRFMTHLAMEEADNSGTPSTGEST